MSHLAVYRDVAVLQACGTCVARLGCVRHRRRRLQERTYEVPVVGDEGLRAFAQRSVDAPAVRSHHHLPAEVGKPEGQVAI